MFFLSFRRANACLDETRHHSTWNAGKLIFYYIHTFMKYYGQKRLSYDFQNNLKLKWRSTELLLNIYLSTKGIEYVPINLDYTSTFDEKLSLFMYHAYSLMSKLTISKKLTQ